MPELGKYFARLARRCLWPVFSSGFVATNGILGGNMFGWRKNGAKRVDAHEASLLYAFQVVGFSTEEKDGFHIMRGERRV